MENNAIKEANRKALPKFLLIMAVSCVIGGFVGFLSAEFGLETLGGSLKAAGVWFGVNAAPWLMVAVAVILPVVSVVLYQQAKKLLIAWDGEDDKVSDAVDTKLSIVLWITKAAMIIAVSLFAAICSSGSSMLESKGGIITACIMLVAYFAVMVETIILQQKCVDATKKMNPEKTASVYDMKFQKKWVESCDEAEKIIIGKCAYKAYMATERVCQVIGPILAVSALIFETGFLPALAVCVIWLINQTVYVKESIKYSKAGNRIS